MAEVVVNVGVKREPGFLYFLRGTDIWRTPMKRAGGPSVAGKAERVYQGSFKREDGFLYFIDGKGHVSRAERAVGGQKRKKSVAEKKTAARTPQTAKSGKASAKPTKAATKKAPAKKVPSKGATQKASKAAPKAASKATPKATPKAPAKKK